jgi:Flp pilus assembly protein TadB
MINTDVLQEPAVLFTVGAIVALTVTLTLAVVRTLQAPAKRQSFDQALEYVMSSELDIDTALNRDEKKSKNWFEYWEHLTNRSGRVVTDPQSPGRAAAGVAIFAIVFGFLVFPGGLMGALAAPAVGLLVMRMFLGGEARKRVIAMEKQLPNLLSGLRANLQAGSTPQQAMLAVADDLPQPLGDEMRLLKRDLNVNVALEIAMEDLAKRVPSREMKFLVASVEIAVRSGADLDPQLATIEDIVKQRTRIRQKLRAAVAQVKPTQFLAYGAVPLMFFVSTRTPDNLAYWFGDGIWILALAGILYGSGGYLIRFMVKGVENA